MTVAGLAAGVNFNVTNGRDETVWIGMKGVDGAIHPINGGFPLEARETVSTGWRFAGVDFILQKGRNYTEANRNIVLSIYNILPYHIINYNSFI
jgi:hypothetical protein